MPAKTLLMDAKTAAEKIARFTSGHDYGSFLESELLQSAVERQFEIIGEALSVLRRTDPKIASVIPDLARIVAFRNILAHAYAAIDITVVWGVVEGEIPGFISLLERLLAESNDGAAGAR